MSDPIIKTPVADEPAAEAHVEQAPADTSSGQDTHIDHLLVTFQDDQGKPYAAKYLDIEDIWKEEPSLKLEVETIEGFLRDQVKRGKIDNTTQAAKKYLAEIEKKSGTHAYDNANTRITKILAYIEFRKVVDG